MEAVEIQVEGRETVGKGAARCARRAGKIPGVLYGPRRPARHLLLGEKGLVSAISAQFGTHLLRLRSSVGDVNDSLVVVKELQRDPVSRRILHADFYEVSPNEALRVRVPVRFIGKPLGVEEAGGLLQPIQRQLDVSCLPEDIPDAIEIDISGLNIHDTIHVSDVVPPDGVTVIYETDQPVVTVSAPVVEEAKVEAEDVAGAEDAPTTEVPDAQAVPDGPAKG